MVANRKDREAEILMPESVCYGNELKGIPEIGAAFRQDFWIIGDPFLHAFDQLYRDIQPDPP